MTQKKNKNKKYFRHAQWEWWLRISNIEPFFHYWKDLSSLLEQRWVIRPSCSDRIVHKSYNLQLKSTCFSKPFWNLFFLVYIFTAFFFFNKILSGNMSTETSRHWIRLHKKEICYFWSWFKFCSLANEHFFKFLHFFFQFWIFFKIKLSNLVCQLDIKQTTILTNAS